MRAVQAALAAGVVGLAVAVGNDVWYRNTLIVRERERVRVNMAPHAQALQSVIGRRVLRLQGLKGFVESRPSQEALTRTFNTFAAGLRIAAPGIRGLQLNKQGRILAMEPMSDGARLLGYNLLTDSRAEIASDVQRAMVSDGVVITGPVALLQGGQGLLFRLKLNRVPETFPDLVSMAVDLEPLLEEANTIAPMPRLRVALLDRQQKPLRGTPAGLSDPATVSVPIQDGAWTLLGEPAGGWQSAVASELRPIRMASALILILLVCVTYLIFGRQAQLKDAVVQRTLDLERANDDLRREVSERERIEQQLRMNDEQLQIALMSGNMGLWGYDPAAKTVTLSEQSLELLGLAGEAGVLAVDRFLDLIPPVLRDTVRDDIARAMQGQLPQAEYVVAQHDGSTRWLHVTATPLSDSVAPGAIPTRIIGVLADITERRLLEEQLLHSQKMEAVGTFAGGIAHDFNNLLTAMMGFAQLADQQAVTLMYDDAPLALRNGLLDLRTELNEIMKAGERAAMLTSQLLAFSRRQKVTPTEVDVNVAVHDIERMLRRLLGERLTLTTRTVERPLPVMVDSGQLGQVLVNLVVNARDAMPHGGTLQLTTDRLDLAAQGEGTYTGVPAGAWAVLTVKDSGTGMSPEVQARMFEPFYTTKAMGDGTGLGLSTVYGILQHAGGRMLVNSVMGVGTTVRILLPRLEDTPVGVAVPPVDDGLPASELILVVEDEPGLRRLVAEILSRRGYRVRVASDGIEALEVLDTERTLPDLVITDVVMPRLGGRGLAETMIARGIMVPVLFMSGYQAGEELPDDHAHAFVPKPFTPDALIAKARLLLDRTRASV